MRTTTTTTSVTVTTMLYDDEAIAAWNSGLAGANSAATPDGDITMDSRPQSPEPPASLNDTEGIARYNRHIAAGELVAVEKAEANTRISANLADEELAARLQEAELVAAQAQHRGEGPSRLATARTPDPATPMDITPLPTPLRPRTAPASPSPATAAVPGHRRPIERAPQAVVGGAALTAFTPYVDPPNAPQHVAGPPPTSTRPSQPTAVPIRQGRTVSQPSASTERGRAARPVLAAAASRSRTAGPSSAVAGPSSAPAGRPRLPPAYVKDAPGPSLLMIPVQPSPENGFADCQTVMTYTTFMEDGTPCIHIVDNDGEAASEGSSNE